MNPFYNIWNYNYISQQEQQLHHQNQVKQVLDTVQKLKDFLDSADNVEAPYQSALSAECCAVLISYAQKHSIMW